MQHIFAKKKISTDFFTPAKGENPLTHFVKRCRKSCLDTANEKNEMKMKIKVIFVSKVIH